MTRGVALGSVGHDPVRLLAHRLDLGRGGWIAGDEPLGQPARPEAQAMRARRPIGSDQAELRAAAADVDDEGLVVVRATLGDPDDGEEGLFFMGEDVQRHPAGPAHLGHDPWCVRGPPDGLGADHGDRRRPQPAGGVDVAGDGLGELGSGGFAKQAVFGDPATQPEEDQFVRDRGQAVVVDPRDQEVDRIRADVDRCADDLAHARPRRAGSSIRRTGSCRSMEVGGSWRVWRPTPACGASRACAWACAFGTSRACGPSRACGSRAASVSRRSRSPWSGRSHRPRGSRRWPAWLPCASSGWSRPLGSSRASGSSRSSGSWRASLVVAGFLVVAAFAVVAALRVVAGFLVVAAFAVVAAFRIAAPAVDPAFLVEAARLVVAAFALVATRAAVVVVAVFAAAALALTVRRRDAGFEADLVVAEVLDRRGVDTAPTALAACRTDILRGALDDRGRPTGGRTGEMGDPGGDGRDLGCGLTGLLAALGDLFLALRGLGAGELAQPLGLGLARGQQLAFELAQLLGGTFGQRGDHGPGVADKTAGGTPHDVRLGLSIA